MSIRTDLEQPRVFKVADRRDDSASDKLFERFNEEQLKEVEAIAMDIWHSISKWQRSICQTPLSFTTASRSVEI